MTYPEWFREGENRLVFTALDDPPDRNIARLNRSLGIRYRCTRRELDHHPDADMDASKIECVIVPSIFYRQTESGLKEVIEAYASFGRTPARGEAELTVAGVSFRTNFTSAEEFGEEQIQFQVPEWTGTIRGELKIGSDSNIRSFPAQFNRRASGIFSSFRTSIWILDSRIIPKKVAELHAYFLTGVMEIQKKVPDFAGRLTTAHGSRRNIWKAGPTKKREQVPAGDAGRQDCPAAAVRQPA